MSPTAPPPPPLLLADRQEDFSAGEQRNVAPHLIDPRGAYQIVNGLLNDEGSIYKRGGSVSVSTAPLGTHLRSAWDGWLQPGRRTLVAATDRFATVDGTNGPVNLGGPGQTVPLPSRALQDLLFLGGGYIYGGSRKGADYSTGKVIVTKGASNVEGVGTKFLANVDAGMLLRIGAEGRVYVVAAVTSDTQLSIRDKYEGETGEVAYTLKRLETASGPYVAAQIYAVAAQRLLICNGNVIQFTESNLPHVLKATIATLPEPTVVENKHEIDEGANIIACESLGVDKALVFHTRGVTSIANLSASIVDSSGASQHRIDKLSSDLVAWGPAGIAGWRNSLVVPAMDNVYLMDGTSNPEPLSHSIDKAYQRYVLEGFSPGGAWVYRDHYFLPILDAAGDPQDLLSCRLDRPYSSRGQTYFPWSTLSGSGAAVSSGVVRSTSAPGDVPAVYGAANDGTLVNLATYFEPSGDVAYDHDDTVPLFTVVLRDFPAGQLSIGRFRKLRLLYEMEDILESQRVVDEEEFATPGIPPFEGEEDENEIEKELHEKEKAEEEAKEKEELEALMPHIVAEVGTGIRREIGALWDEVNWDEFDWAASDEETQFELLKRGAPPNAGARSALAQNAWVWYLRTRARYVRFRLQVSDPVAKLTIRSVEIFVAKQGGVRQAKVVDS